MLAASQLARDHTLTSDMSLVQAEHPLRFKTRFQRINKLQGESCTN
jgi:hypothetical protein